MGGYGSGQYQSYDAKSLVEHSICLNIFKLYREGWIQWNKHIHGSFSAGERCTMGFILANNVLTLSYTITSGKHKDRSMRYGIRISQTYPNYGGVRLWFHCPHCDRRSGKLYLAPGQIYYLCRRCAQLTYQSTRETSLQKIFASIRAEERRVSRFLAKYGKVRP